MAAPVKGGVDGHAHVWHGPLAIIPGARHVPGRDAPVESYIGHLDRHGLAMGLLIQPSFLGTDNSIMLDAVRRHPDRLKAVVVIDPTTPMEKLIELGGQGVVGVRFNLIGLPLPDFAGEPLRSFLKRLAELKWHVEIHRESRDLPEVMPPLLATGVRVAIDHYGRPDPKALAEDPGFRYLLTTAASGRVWVKISAAYRSGGKKAAMSLTPALLEHFQPDRLPWGSDWPHTQHESTRYESTLDLFRESVADERIRALCLSNAIAELWAT